VSGCGLFSPLDFLSKLGQLDLDLANLMVECCSPIAFGAVTEAVFMWRRMRSCPALRSVRAGRG